VFENILSNKFAQIATILAVPIAFIADYINSPLAYLGAFLVVILLFIFAYFDESKKEKLYNQKNIPIPIVFNISNPANSNSALGSIFDNLDKNYPDHKKNLKKYLNIIESDLVFKYDGDIFDEKRFVDFLKVTKHDIKKLESKTTQNIHFHIVYIGPIANAVLIGTMLGTEGITLYQYNKSTDNYTISMEINSREYKEHIDEFKIIKKSILGDISSASSVTVAIDLASHKVSLAKLQEPVIHLESTIGATLHKPEDFIRANQEIYAVINELQQQDRHITLAYSMPTTIAILLGMGIQNYWDIELTQFNDGEYKSVIKQLNSIKYYF
jgi:hypothetical protein